MVLMGGCALLLGISHALTRKVLVQSVEPLLAVTLRNVVSAVIVLGIGVGARRITGRARRFLSYDRWTWLAVAGKSLSGIFYFYALSGLSATVGILLYRLNPVYTLLFALGLVPAAVRRELSLGALVLGTMLSVGGATLGAWKLHGLNGDVGSGVNAGVLFMLLAGPCFSLFIVSWEKHRASALGETDFAARQGYLAQIEFLALLPLLVGVGFLMWRHGWELPGGRPLGELVLLGAISGGIGVLYFEAVKRIGALLASVIVGLEVHVTIFCEQMWLGEPVTAAANLGGLLVLAGAALVARENQVLIRNL